MESSSFVIKQSDISTNLTATSASSSAGYWTDGRARTVYSVNLRELVGSATWDKHRKFVFRINSISHTGANGFAVSAFDQAVLVRITGFRFLNSTYNLLTKSMSNYIDAYPLFIENNQARSYYLSQSTCKFMFEKSEDNIQLMVELIRQDNGQLAQCTATLFPHMTIMGDIWPIPE